MKTIFSTIILFRRPILYLKGWCTSLKTCDFAYQNARVLEDFTILIFKGFVNEIAANIIYCCASEVLVQLLHFWAVNMTHFNSPKVLRASDFRNENRLRIMIVSLIWEANFLRYYLITKLIVFFQDAC